MLPGMYRLTNPLLALIPENGRLAAHKIPAGELIEVEAGSLYDGRLMGVKWGHETVMAFNVDLHMRTKMVESSGVLPTVGNPLAHVAAA